MHREDLNRKQDEFLDNLTNEVLGKWKNSWSFAKAVHPYFVFKSAPIGYHSNATHEDVMKDLICNDCGKVPLPFLPVTVFECKHVYCNGCRYDNCCRTQQQSNTHIVTNLKRLSIVCPYVVEGGAKCFWTGSLEAWRKHLNTQCPGTVPSAKKCLRLFGVEVFRRLEKQGLLSAFLANTDPFEVVPVEPKIIAENCDKIAKVASELVKVKKELENEKQRHVEAGKECQEERQRRFQNEEFETEKQRRVQLEKDFEAEKKRRVQLEKDFEAEKQLRIRIEELETEKQRRVQLEKDFEAEKQRRVQVEKDVEAEKQRRIIMEEFEAEKQRRVKVEKDLEVEKQRRIEAEGDYSTEQKKRLKAERSCDELEKDLESVNGWGKEQRHKRVQAERKLEDIESELRKVQRELEKKEKNLKSEWEKVNKKKEDLESVDKRLSAIIMNGSPFRGVGVKS